MGRLGLGPVARVRLGLGQLAGRNLLDMLNNREGAGIGPTPPTPPSGGELMA